MPLPPELQSLVDAATSAIAKVSFNAHGSDNDEHTVGSALITSSGAVYAGVNIYHFTGGPCAESVAIGNALQAGEAGGDFICIVAVGDKGRGVLSPCGRCRQMLLDYYPWIKVIVADRERHENLVLEIEKLLPFSYVWPRDSQIT